MKKMQATKSQQMQLDTFSGKYGGRLFSVTSHHMNSNGHMIINLNDCTGADRGAVNVSRRGAMTAC